jgi:ABC-2 type transport system permease protein
MYYFDLVAFGFARLKAYPSEMVFFTLERLLAFAFLMIFWGLVQPGSAEHMSMHQISSYFLIVQGLSVLFIIRDDKLGSFFRKSIKTGDISNFLIKPVNVVLAMVATTFGNRALESTVSLLLIAAGLIVDPPQSVFSCLLFLVFCVCSALLGFSFNLLEGVLTFYTTEPSGIMNAISHIKKVFSGFWVPLVFFPSALRNIVELSPFPAMLYTPYESLHYTSFSDNVVLNLAVSIGWSLVLLIVMMFFWKKGLRKYEAIGI